MMTRRKHPSNKFERLHVEHKKAEKNRLQEQREGRIRARFAREALKIQEAEDVVADAKWSIRKSEEATFN